MSLNNMNNIGRITNAEYDYSRYHEQMFKVAGMDSSRVDFPPTDHNLSRSQIVKEQIPLN